MADAELSLSAGTMLNSLHNVRYILYLHSSSRRRSELVLKARLNSSKGLPAVRRFDVPIVYSSGLLSAIFQTNAALNGLSKHSWWFLSPSKSV